MEMSRSLFTAQEIVYADAQRCGDCGQARLIRSREAVLPVRDGRLVDLEHIGELLLVELLRLSKCLDAGMHRTGEALPLLLSFHARTVDPESTLVNGQ